MTDGTVIACLYLAPWPVTLVARQHRHVPVAVLSGGNRRVIAATPDALAAGVLPGMRESAAYSRCPELHAEVVSGPVAQAAWKELLELLYAKFSDRVEGVDGIAYLRLHATAAQELATALHAPVGVASSKEVALLAALRAQAGEVRGVSAEQGGQAEKAFLHLTPLAHLWALGLHARQLEHLRFLGITGLADLWAWSAAQRESFLGVDTGRRLNRFLRGERTVQVSRYVPGQVIGASLEVDAPLEEPAQLEAALGDLLPTVWENLRGRTAAYLTVQAQTVAGEFSSTRNLKWPLDEAGLLRRAVATLMDTPALPLGIDRLTVQVSGLQKPSRMVGLWAGVAELDVTRDLLDRFPGALVRVNWLDPFAYATDARYAWVDWQTGERRSTALTPKPPFASPRKQREKAPERVLAFFEGRL